ncbi:MAG: hypothetical protein KF857_11425 [Fimbriimonadaceae bacterium]|nr:hypothetical protein [Fimbriimonadaceae bacterium]
MIVRPLLLSALGFFSLGFQPSPPPQLHVLVVGGGPQPKYNQVAIESNVRYIDRVKPSNTDLRVLFTDGNPESKNVLCQGEGGKTYYRAPQLPRQDGPAHLATVQAEFASLAERLRRDSAGECLVYFTGHGSPNKAGNLNNNHFDLWDNQRLTVTDMAASLKQFPKDVPVTLLMVECYSGSFAYTLFEDGLPDAQLADRKICGFFASVQQRMAAGCTPNVNEAEYRDFTGYFLAALTGKDRMGRDVQGVDYNKDGRVGMDEAFAYSLVHDNSIDTPVCTSDVFLRRFVTTKDADIMATSFSQVRSWARPAQLVALDGLSTALGYDSEDRLQVAYNAFIRNPVNSAKMRDVNTLRFVRLAKSVVLQHQLDVSGAPEVKRRFAELLKLEAANPLRPARA